MNITQLLLYFTFFSIHSTFPLKTRMQTERTLDKYFTFTKNSTTNNLQKTTKGYQKALKKLPYNQTTLNKFVGIKDNSSYIQMQTEELQNHSNSSISKQSFSYQIAQKKRKTQQQRKHVQIELRRGLREALEENDTLRDKIIELQALYFQSCLRLQQIQEKRLLSKRCKRDFSL